MYRIHFDPETGKFLVQIATGLFGMFWKNVCQVFAGGVGESPVDVAKPRQFGTFKEAKEYTASIGLDQLYEDRSANHFRAHLGR